ncbi:unnamed protein product [Parnassius apollo]|uniref:(apollo) hypothetical protein n=1 Tax=Parnassius apollo TaxID=110799 RepID=A0A8S3Y5C0_PARAO|nr:unnamed protein product [Parnassius apollo]
MALSDRKLKRKQFEENSMSLQILEPEQKRRKTKTSSVINVTSIMPAINVPGPSKFPVVAITLDRYGISDCAGAAIVSATLQDNGLVTESDTSSVIDRSKIRRARAQTRSSRAAVNVLNGDDTLVCISFDGRKDKTMLYEDNRRKIVVEEHITLVKEPNSQYIGHITLATANALTISKKLYLYLALKCDLKRIIAIGCDGTSVNTGNKAGIIYLLEKKLHRPLQWLVCLLQTNELSLRHLFEHLDGKTTGPRSFTGVIGKALKGCENLPVVQFTPIACSISVCNISVDISKSRSDLSTDQLYLYEIYDAVSRGQCDDIIERSLGHPIVVKSLLVMLPQLGVVYIKRPCDVSFTY